MSDAWISNASPLITLAAIDGLDLFAALKAELWVPATVLNEVGASADRADDRVRASGRFVLVPDVAIATEAAHWAWTRARRKPSLKRSRRPPRA